VLFEKDLIYIVAGFGLIENIDNTEFCNGLQACKMVACLHKNP